MKIILFGANGTLGKAIAKELGQRHEVIGVNRTKGDFQADLAQPSSIEALFKKLGSVDAVLAAAGETHFGPLDQMTPELYSIGIQNKLMGQVNLTLAAQKYLKEGGSITLTSGILVDNPIKFGSSASMVSGALESFTKAAAIELPRGIRINCVSPTLLTESATQYGPYFQGFETVPASRVALAYSRSVEGHQTGQIYRVG